MRARYLSSLFEKIPLRFRVVIKSELDGFASLAHPYISPLTQFIFQLEKHHGSDHVTTQGDLAALTQLVINYGSLHCNTHYCLTNNSEHVAHQAVIALAKALTRAPNLTNTREVLRYETCRQGLNTWRTQQGLAAVMDMSYLSLLNPRLQNEMTLNYEPIHTIPLAGMVLSDKGLYAWHINDLQAAIGSTRRLTNPYASDFYLTDDELRRIFTKSADLAADYKAVIEHQILPARVHIQDTTIQKLLSLIETIITPSLNQAPEARQQQFNEKLQDVLNALSTTEKNAINNLSISVADHNKSLLDYRNDPETCFPEMINNFYLTLKNFVRATHAISILQNIEEITDDAQNGYHFAKLHAR